VLLDIFFLTGPLGVIYSAGDLLGPDIIFMQLNTMTLDPHVCAGCGDLNSARPISGGHGASLMDLGYRRVVVQGGHCLLFWE
jgi:hypothetical protein